MKLDKRVETSGRDHYEVLYQHELEQEAEWLRRGADDKTNSIERLLRNNHIRPHNLLELGCGTGAVITDCQKRGLAEKYTAVDYSQEAITYLKDHSKDIETVAADISEWNVSERRFDVVILSHVLEHLEDPDKFLQSLQKINFSHIVIEVPLEDLPFSKIKSLVKDRRSNKAGHVQFFTARSLRSVLQSNGLKIIDSHRYMPLPELESFRFIAAKDNLSKLKSFQSAITGYYLPRMFGELWKQLYYAHYAVLCEKEA